MTHSLLKLTLFSGLALGAAGVAAQTEFPMSAAGDSFTAPSPGVVTLTVLGRSVATPTFPLSVSDGHYSWPRYGVALKAEDAETY